MYTNCIAKKTRSEIVASMIMTDLIKEAATKIARLKENEEVTLEVIQSIAQTFGIDETALLALSLKAEKQMPAGE